MKDSVKTEKVLVVPAQAQLWLLKNLRNRPIRKRLVNNLVSQIRRGQWRLSTDAIGFDKAGNLINGQHRLTACIEANKPIELLVAHGLDPEAFNVIDTGKVRDAGDILGVNGFGASHSLAAICRGVMHYNKKKVIAGRNQSRTDTIDSPTNQDILNFAEKNKTKLDDAYEVALNTSKSFKGLKARQIGVLYWIFSEIDRDHALTFFHYLSSGANLGEKDPIRVLRERLISELTSKKKYPEIDKMAWTIMAWNHSRAGNKITKLIWQGQKENFPIPK